MTLDAYCATHDLGHVDVLKVDVEGAEHLVFQGGEKLLSGDRAPILMFEVVDSLAEQAGSSGAKNKQQLLDLGYSLYRPSGEELVVAQPSDHHGLGEDLLAVKPEHVERHPVLRARLPRSR